MNGLWSDAAAPGGVRKGRKVALGSSEREQYGTVGIAKRVQEQHIICAGHAYCEKEECPRDCQKGINYRCAKGFQKGDDGYP